MDTKNLTPAQIEAVVDWMNTWEQLKDTAIPLRFKEDFTKHVTSYYRPKTIGELYDALLQNIKCEVAAANIENTLFLLQELINVDGRNFEFKICPSIQNEWIICEAIHLD